MHLVGCEFGLQTVTSGKYTSEAEETNHSSQKGIDGSQFNLLIICLSPQHPSTAPHFPCTIPNTLQDEFVALEQGLGACAEEESPFCSDVTFFELCNGWFPCVKH